MIFCVYIVFLKLGKCMGLVNFNNVRYISVKTNDKEVYTMNKIHYPPVLYRTSKIGEMSYRYREAVSPDDIVRMMVEVTRKIDQECLMLCLVDMDHKPRYIRSIRKRVGDVRMSDIFTLAVSLDMSGLLIVHRYPEKIALPSADLSLCNEIADVASLLGMSLYGYILVGGEDILFRSSDVTSVLH